jgi:hypothetical protein
VGGQKVERGEEEFGKWKGECEKGLLGSGIKYCGTCLIGVREVIGE